MTRPSVLLVIALLCTACTGKSSQGDPPASEAAPEQPETQHMPQEPKLLLGSGKALLTGPGELRYRGPLEIDSWLAKQGALEDLWLGWAVCVRTSSGVWCRRHEGDEVRLELPSAEPVVAVDSNFASICALTSDGALWCSFGRDPEMRALRRFPIAEVVVEIDVHDDYGCARLEDGSARCWRGDHVLLHDYCQQHTELSGCDGLGPDQAKWPAPSDSFANVRDIAVGDEYACVLDEHGAAHCRDDAEYGEGTTVGGRGEFTAIGGMPDLLAIDGGSRHVCARADFGEVWCWGSNRSGQLADGTTQSQRAVKPVHVWGFAQVHQLVVHDDESCVFADAQVQCWGWLRETPADPIPTQISAVVAHELDVGATTACARENAIWRCWGGVPNWFSKSLGGIAEVAEIRDWGNSIAVGDHCSFAQGRLRCDEDGVWLDVRGVIDVSRSIFDVCFLRGERVQCRHALDLGEPELSLEVPASVAIAGQADHGCVLTKAGEVLCWASKEGPAVPLELPGNQVAIGVGQDDDACTLDEAGMVRCWSAEHPIVQAGVSDIVELHGGLAFGCARDRAGAIACWGKYLVGDLDTPDPTAREPVRLELPAPAVEFGLGEDYGCARLEDRRVFCWGAEHYGQRARVSSQFALKPRVITIDRPR